MPDDAINDFFATQFASAIVKESGGEGTTYWFGRMMRFLDNDEYVFRNFFGTDYTETEFREKFEKGEITVSAFDISDVVYKIDPNDPTMAVVRMNVRIDAVIDNQDLGGNFTLVHKVKQGWQAYESEFSPAEVNDPNKRTRKKSK